MGVSNGHFQKIVGLLKLIIKGQIVLGQLKGFQSAGLGHVLAQDIERSKEPAPSGLLLGRYAARLHLDGKCASEESRAGGNIGQIRHVGFGHGRTENPGLSV